MVSALRSPARRAIVGCLDDAEDGLTAGQLAEFLELHVTTVRFRLNQLIEAHIVDTATARTPNAGRPNKLYRLVREEVRPPSDSYEVMAELVASIWRNEAATGILDAEGIGRRWAIENLRAPLSLKYPVSHTPGVWLAKLGTIVDLMDALGYEAEISTTNQTKTACLSIRNCPYANMTSASRSIICALHKGLLRGALDALGEEDAVLELNPFATQTSCSASLSTPSLNKGAAT